MFKCSFLKKELKYIFAITLAVLIENHEARAMQGEPGSAEKFDRLRPKMSKINEQWLQESDKELAKREYIISRREENNGDYFEAFLWMEKAAYRGNNNAQYNLGLMYVQYFCDLEHLQEALNWLNEAKRNGHPNAQKKVGQLQYLIGMTYFMKNDYRTALPWLKIAQMNHMLEAKDAIHEIQEEEIPFSFYIDSTNLWGFLK